MSTGPEEALTKLLLGLELRLMDPAFRRDRAGIGELLDEDFREFGSSGRVWSRETLLESLAAEASSGAPEIEEFAMQRIAAEVALATYRTVRRDSSSVRPQASWRSSLWRLREGRWQMVFHQGTPVSLPEAREATAKVPRSQE